MNLATTAGVTPDPTASAAFDPAAGNRLERWVFGHRRWVVLVCALLTLLLGGLATRVQLNASFEGMLPLGHPYLQNYLAERKKLVSQANSLRIVLERRDAGGTVLDKAYLERLRALNDELFVLPGVVRGQMKSLWTPSTRWTAVTERGFEGGTVIPDDYDGSAAALARVRLNIERSGEVGQLVARDYRSTALIVPLAERGQGGEDGAALDYTRLQQQLEALRTKYSDAHTTLRITGFAKVVGDLIEGMAQVLLFFGLAAAIASAVVLWYTRCWRSTALVMLCSVVAVVWQLGLLPLLGFALDPYAVLVPFLVFAIGMSHGAQKMNGVMQDIGRGLPRLQAARLTFRRLFIAGFTALVCDAVGFAVLLLIDIQAIRHLAIIASLGVAVLVFTNLILLPVLLSYTGVSPAAAARSLRTEAEDGRGGFWGLLVRFTERRWALAAIGSAALLTAGGVFVARGLQVGDLDAGAPELRPSSRYNLDNAYLTQHYATSSDVMTVMVRTTAQQAMQHAVLEQLDDLEWRLRQLPGVEGTQSLATLARQTSVAMNEGHPRWYELQPNQGALNTAGSRAGRHLVDGGFTLLQLQVYLADHKADTLRRVSAEVEAFAREHQSQAREGAQGVQVLLAAGNAGFEAATNAVVERANREMLLWVYAAVVLLAWLTFRSWRAVACAIVPLAVTSVLAEALMVALGIGLKVATLPVVALGVGIGVDYALYVLSILLAELRRGTPLAEAYRRALQFTGRVVMLTGVTLAIGVATWALSPIKFQADMGVLLAFMFVVNMVGALVLLPALAHFLLRPVAQPAGVPVAPAGLARSHA